MDEPTPKGPDSSSELSYEETPIINTDKGELLEHQTTIPPVPEANQQGVTYERADVLPEASQYFQAQQGGASSPPPSQEPLTVPQSSKQSSMPTSRFHVGTFIFIGILFGLGVWLSMQLRSFFATSPSQEVAVPTLAAVTPVPTQNIPQASPSAAANAVWTTYRPISGATRKEIDGVSYKLPSDVAAPMCDGGSCVSQGTNLPNGTRFTIAVRGKGQLLPDFRGAILTDANGREFTMKQTTIQGIFGYEYVGNFSGRTGGGYAFSAMRGIEIPVSDTLAIEFNHFAPIGTVSDFAKDEVVFDSIIGTFKSTVPAPSPTASFMPSAIPVSSSSGY